VNISKNKSSIKVFDVAVIGGGLAGVLASLEFCAQGLSVVLLEKDERLGGKLKTTDWEKKTWSPGVVDISQTIYKQINILLQKNNFKSLNLEANSLLWGLFAQKQISTMQFEDFVAYKGAEIAFGKKTAETWQGLYRDAYTNKKAFSTAEKKGVFSKAPMSTLFKMLTEMLEMPNLKIEQNNSIKERRNYFDQIFYKGNYENILVSCIEKIKNITINPATQVLSSTRQAGEWSITTTKEIIKAKKILVAHSSWEALRWLPKHFFPTQLLKMTLHCRPTSSVYLIKKILNKNVATPRQSFILSELTKVKNHNDSLYFTKSIDYETTLDSPQVVKAIRQLRRAADKIVNFDSSLQLDNEHIGLCQVQWPQTASFLDSSTKNMFAKNDYISPSLAFCGASYGTSSNPDINFINSLAALSKWAKI
jgi:hypothetical protein